MGLQRKLKLRLAEYFWATLVLLRNKDSIGKAVWIPLASGWRCRKPPSASRWAPRPCPSCSRVPAPPSCSRWASAAPGDTADWCVSWAADRWTPCETPCSQCHRTDSTLASWGPPLPPLLDLQITDWLVHLLTFYFIFPFLKLDV